MDDEVAEIEILRLFLSYSRTLSLSGTPQRKIAAAKWEIFFQNRLSEVEKDPPLEMRQPDTSGAHQQI